ncbi:Non-hemolytic phospholipase C precursor [Chromobacterium violaceum]|uniref:Non-hemolytic phospholipase C n=1 Tax=Chromobacterium violaceum TaxID=536 RepID=A0A3S4I489_CHRVL|nr:Non-hemolytic phospholipase C precursor [Chromobacterium violaceum]
MDPAGKNGGPVTDNSEKGYSWTTYPERLQAAGVSWKVYQVLGDNYDDNALAWFNQYRSAKPGNPLCDRGMSSVPKVSGNSVQDLVAAIRNDAVNGTLPQVSWIVAPEAYSEHPSAPPAAGAYLLDRVLQALTANPDVWASTVLLLNYDENDGLFDHMPPPVPPAGTAAEFIGGKPIGLGPRVPMLVLSPWSRGGHVCSQVFDHTSVIRFLETWTGVQEPNISAWRRQICGDLSSALDFSSRNASVPAFPDTAALLTQAQQSKGWPAPTAPLPGQMPAPEGGRRPARALPYQCNAYGSTDLAGGIFWVHMQNSGSQAVHYAIYANQYRSDGPWQYDVAGGGEIKDYFHAQTYGGGLYDLTVYGPNGFLRRFAGNLRSAMGVLEAVSAVSVVAGVPQLTLQLNNQGAKVATFQVSGNGYGGAAPQQVVVTPGSSQLLSWNLSGVYGWYDFTVTCTGDGSFVRRLVGHVETAPPASPAERAPVPAGGAAACPSGRQLAAQALLHLAPLPVRSQDRQQLEGVDRMRQQAHAPAQRRPHHPPVMGRGQQVDDDQRGHHQRVLDQVAVETLETVHMLQRQHFLQLAGGGGAAMASGVVGSIMAGSLFSSEKSISNTEASDFSDSTLAPWPRSMRWMVRTLKPLRSASCCCDQPRCSLSFCISIKPPFDHWLQCGSVRRDGQGQRGDSQATAGRQCPPGLGFRLAPTAAAGSPLA